MPRGIPYDQEFRDEVMAYAKGHTLEETSIRFGVSVSNISRWRKLESEAPSPKKFVFKKPSQTAPPSPLALPPRREPKEVNVAPPPPAPQPTPTDVPLPRPTFAEILDKHRGGFTQTARPSFSAFNHGYKAAVLDYDTLTTKIITVLRGSRGDSLVYSLLRERILDGRFAVISPYSLDRGYYSIAVQVTDRSDATIHLHGSWDGTRYMMKHATIKYFENDYTAYFNSLPSTP